MADPAILHYPPEPKKVTRLGDELLTRGILSIDQLEVALHEKSRTGKMLGTVLVDLGFVSHQVLNDLLSARSGHIVFDPSVILFDPELAQRLPRLLADQHRILPLSFGEDGILMGMVDPFDVMALDAARHAFPRDLIVPVLFTARDHLELVDAIHHHKLELTSLLRELRQGQGRSLPATLDPEGLSHPIVRLINALLLEAVRSGASDLHFEPCEFFAQIRLRINGELQHTAAIHNDFWSALSHRLKIMGGMNIANRLMPQDGRFSMSILGRKIDFRIASLPGLYGENITIRVLDSSRELLDVAALGFSRVQLAQLERLLARPEGLIVVTGPTGSGKTTTLYAMLRQLATIKRNVMTLEDPIEYQLPMLRQTQVREQSGLTFAEGVRAILRQDPDVILIGEIRDAETAQMAMRAAMTGHLVFTTLHTRDVFGVIPRLLDFGISPTLLSGNLNAVIAQRLVRQLCPACKQPDGELYKASGCATCRQTGYKGRIAMAEIFEVHGARHEHLFDAPDRAAWRAAAKADRQPTLLETARERLLAGDIDEIEYNRLQSIGFGDA